MLAPTALTASKEPDIDFSYCTYARTCLAGVTFAVSSVPQQSLLCSVGYHAILKSPYACVVIGSALQWGSQAT